MATSYGQHERCPNLVANINLETYFLPNPTQRKHKNEKGNIQCGKMDLEHTFTFFSFKTLDPSKISSKLKMSDLKLQSLLLTFEG